MLNRDFKEFAELLDARDVEYLVVVGYALAWRSREVRRLLRTPRDR